MKLSEFGGKEIVNIFDGMRLGTVNESDLIIDAATGTIKSLVIPNKSFSFWFRRHNNPLIIPWEVIQKIGTQIIIVDMELDKKNKVFK